MVDDPRSVGGRRPSGRGGRLIPHDGGGMPEELLDIALVAIRRLVIADGVAEPSSLDERLDCLGRRVLEMEPSFLELAIVDAAPVAQQLQVFVGEVQEAEPLPRPEDRARTDG